MCGALTPQQIRLALEEFVTRHESLRTRYRVNGSAPIPVLDADASKVLVLAGEGSEQLAGGLDLENGPLVRGEVSAVAPCECVVDLIIHHLAYDGASGTVFVRELGAARGAKPSRPHAGCPARNATHPSPAAARRRGEGAVRVVALAAARPGGRAGVTSGPCPKTFGRGSRPAPHPVLNTTPFVVAAAAWALVLSRQDGEPAVTIGTPVDLRDPATEDRLVGYHTNVVVIEVEVSANEAVQDLILRFHAAVGRALANRHWPYAALVADQRAATGTPPTRTLLSVERLERVECSGVSIRQ